MPDNLVPNATVNSPKGGSLLVPPAIHLDGGTSIHVHQPVPAGEFAVVTVVDPKSPHNGKKGTMSKQEYT